MRCSILLVIAAVLALPAAAYAAPVDTSKTAHDVMFPIPGPQRALFESFEASVPPAGWSAVVNNPYTWEQSSQKAYQGTYSATCFYDLTLSGPQNESICFDYTMQAADECLCFFAIGSIYWAVEPYQNYNFMVTINGNEVWNYRDDNDGAVTWQWQPYCVNLSGYAVDQSISVCLVYQGYDGAQASFDAVYIGDCPGGIDPCCPSSYVCYEFDFNQVDGGATTFACGNGPVPWEWGVPYDTPEIACDGVAVTNAWGTAPGEDYSPSTGQGLMVGPFAITPSCDCMELCHWYDTETGYDGGNVKVSTNGGSSWQLVYPQGGYDDILDSPSYHAECVWGEQVFTGHRTEFQRRCFDLSAFDGENVYVGFFFGTDSSSNYYGWYLKWIKFGTSVSPVEQSSWGVIKAMYR